MNQLLNNRPLTKVIIALHLLLTLASAALFFTGIGELYAILGSHVVVYPILGLAIAATLESLLLVAVCFVYWGISMTALTVGFYSALRNNRFGVLAIVSAADAVFSAFVLILSVCVGTLNGFHGLMLLGVVLSVLFAVYTWLLHRTHKPAEE